MQKTESFHPLDSITAALGGRRLAMLAWILWKFGCIVGHYAITIGRGEELSFRGGVALTTCGAGFLLYLTILCRDLSRRDRRVALFSRQTDLPEPSRVMRILVILVPTAGVGAVLAPLVIR